MFGFYLPIRSERSFLPYAFPEDGYRTPCNCAFVGCCNQHGRGEIQGCVELSVDQDMPAGSARAHNNSFQLAMILRYAPTNHKYSILVVHYTQHVCDPRTVCESCGMCGIVYLILSAKHERRGAGGKGAAGESCRAEICWSLWEERVSFLLARWEMFTVDTALVCVFVDTAHDAGHEMSSASGLDAVKRGDVFMRQATHTCPGSVSIIYFAYEALCSKAVSERDMVRREWRMSGK